MAELTAAQLADALHELGEIDNELSRIASYTMLRKAVDVTSEQNRDLGAAVDAAIVQARNALRFFELEWLALDDERAGELLAAPEVAADRHYLTAQRRYRDHVLSEPEERALGERDPAAVSAWQTLYAQTTSTIEVPFDSGDGPQPHTIDRLLAYVHDSRRDVRLAALDTLYAALEAPAPVLAHCYDSLVADRLVSDRLRSYGDDPMLPTHLDNELDAPVVQAMLEQVEARYPLAQRWFRAKASMMGLDVLELADQYAPLGEARAVGYDEGRSLVDAAFAGFSPQVASIAEAFFTEQRVDAEPRAGKRGGAFCSPVAQDASPYVMLNYTDTMNDVLTIAHELGHGMHFQLAHAAQTPHSAHTGLALAEVPSTFAEFVAYDHLLANEEDRPTRQALTSERVEGAFATIFRQTVLGPLRAGRLRAAGRLAGALGRPPQRHLDRAEPALLRRQHPPVGRLPAGLVVHPPLHLDPLLHLRLRVREAGRAGAVRALAGAGRGVRGALPEFMAAGGSGAPADLLAVLGIDLSGREIWDTAFDELERMIAAAESEA